MSLNSTPLANRTHIGFFGKRNSGKSSLVNAVTSQELSVVSDTPGTTTDPVFKTMELLPIGPVVIIDTPGFDDEGALGELRIKKTREVLNRIDAAVLVVDSEVGLLEGDRELLEVFEKRKIPCIVAFNKSDLHIEPDASDINVPRISVSALRKTGIDELKELMGRVIGEGNRDKAFAGDLVETGDLVILVIPIDEAAPKGRIILPQQLAIRDLLEAGALVLSVKDTELRFALDTIGKKPKLVITDSQAFGEVSRMVPADIHLTSFSVLMARYNGFLETAVESIKAIDSLKPGDRILISEACTHHRQCGDIGSVKIPAWLNKHLGFTPELDFSSGREFPEDLSRYKAVIHCGGCMINEREMQFRKNCAIHQGVPFINYGILIAYMNNILDRSLEVLKKEF